MCAIWRSGIALGVAPAPRSHAPRIPGRQERSARASITKSTQHRRKAPVLPSKVPRTGRYVGFDPMLFRGSPFLAGGFLPPFCSPERPASTPQRRLSPVAPSERFTGWRWFSLQLVNAGPSNRSIATPPDSMALTQVAGDLNARINKNHADAPTIVPLGNGEAFSLLKQVVPAPNL
jgi:hypothetical protein